MTLRAARNKKRREERQAIERAQLRLLRSLSFYNDPTTLHPHVQAQLIGLEAARRRV